MTREELLKVIGKAKRSGQTKLDLSAELIEELPSEIGQLINLTSLDLSNTQLTLPRKSGHSRRVDSRGECSDDAKTPQTIY